MHLVPPPPPPPDASRPVAFYDTECYPNYWLLKFRPKGQPAYAFRLLEGQTFDPVTVGRIKLLFDAFTSVSFNGNGYDVPMITVALCGYNVEQLKWLNDRMIVEKVKPWELGLPEWKPRDHIDVMEVAPGAGSQKQYAGRIHCKKMQDLPYDPSQRLTPPQIEEVELYCENDLDVLEALHGALAPQLKQRVRLSARYGMDLRSKSDAQLAEAVLKKRCEQAVGQRLFKAPIDWNLKFRYKIPSFISFRTPQLQRALELVRDSVFTIGDKGTVTMPPQLEGLTVQIGNSSYKMGIGGLHSQEKCVVHKSDDNYILRDSDVASYYPSLMINSGEVPTALGRAFIGEFSALKNERLTAKALEGKLKREGFVGTVEWQDANADNEGGKIMINGTFGKTGSPYSILFAPEMLIQTTLTGQLALLMLIEWHELEGIAVVSANTDGIVTKCPRNMVDLSDALVKRWETLTGLEMETVEYRACYSRDVNNYFIVKADGSVKRKGEFSRGGLLEKKNPDVEICSDAVADFLANGTPILYTLAACRDIRKFVVIQKVNGGGVKLWGEGARKGALVRDMIPVLQANGWVKDGRKWSKASFDPIHFQTRQNTPALSASEAYQSCFAPQTPEYLGKVVRWYYATNAPGPIVYESNGNTVGMSYGAKPCMTLPDEFPADIDYHWHLAKCENILRDIGYYVLQ